MTSPRALTLSAALLLLFTSTPVAAGHTGRRDFARYPLLDSIDVIVRNGDVIAVNGTLGGAVAIERLQLGEQVLRADARGAVAIVVTNERVLATTLGSPRWMWTYIGVHESLPLAILVGDSVALVLTDKRAIGLSAETRHKFFAEDIGPNETLRDYFVGESVAVVVTDKRLLGLSAFLPGFFAQSIGVHDRIEYVSALSDFATVSTRQYLFVFQAPTASWAQRRLRLR